jgi:hypothetical protein
MSLSECALCAENAAKSSFLSVLLPVTGMMRPWPTRAGFFRDVAVTYVYPAHAGKRSLPKARHTRSVASGERIPLE